MNSARSASTSGLAHLHRVHIQLDRNVAVDGHQLLAEQNVVAIVLERFAISFLFDFGGAIERLLDRAETLDEFDRTFVADAGSAGNVVDGVAAQGHDVDDALGRHTEDFLDFGRVANQIVLGRIQDQHAVVDQLQHVLVAGDHVDRVRLRGGFAGERADHVVGFVAGQLEDRNAVGLERAPDVGHLLRQIGGHLVAIGFVAVVFDFLKGLRLQIEVANTGDGLRPADREKLAQPHRTRRPDIRARNRRAICAAC